MHLVLLAVTVHGGRPLRHLPILVGQELLLVVQRVANVRVVVALVLHHLVQEVLVVDLGARWIDLGLVSRILLEHLFAMLNIANNLLGHEDRDGPFAHIKLEAGSRDSHGRIARALPLARVLGRLSCNVQGEAALHGRLRVETSVVVVAHLGKVCHCLGEVARHSIPACRAGPSLTHGCHPRIKEALALRCIGTWHFLCAAWRIRQVRAASQLLHNFIVLVLLVAKLGLGPGRRQRLLVEVAAVALHVDRLILAGILECLALSSLVCGGAHHGVLSGILLGLRCFAGSDELVGGPVWFLVRRPV